MHGACISNLRPKTSIQEITGIAVDSVGDIFVTDSESNSVSAFQSIDKGDVEPSAMIVTHTNIFEPTGVALDFSGRIYVANGNRDRAVSDTVTIYAPAATRQRRLSEASQATRPMYTAHSRSRLIRRARFMSPIKLTVTILTAASQFIRRGASAT